MYFKQGATIERSNSTVTSAGTLILVNTSETYQYFTGTTTHTMKLPDATNLKQGMRWEVINQSTGSITVQDGSGATIGTVSSTSTIIFRLITPGTTAGSWDVTTASAGGGTGALSAADSAAFAVGASQTFTLTSKPLKFNPEEISGDYWLVRAGLTVLRAYSAGFSLNGLGYSSGGVDSTDTLVVGYVDRYNDDLNYWISKTANTGRYYPAGFNLNGFGYSVGGGNAVNDNSGTNTNQKYTDSTDTWTTATAMSVSRLAMFYFTLRNGPYVLGGSNSTPAGTTDNYTYSDSANAWYIRSPLPAANAMGSSVSLNGYGYVNQGTPNDGTTKLNTSYKFNEAINSFTTAATLNYTRALSAGNTVNGFGLAFGGFDGTNSDATNEDYSDATTSWRQRAPMSTAKNGMAAFSLNGASYSAAGRLTPTNAQTSDVEAYVNSSVFNINLLSRTTSVPNSISAAVFLNGLTQSVPVQVRTDGNNWKLFTANGGSATKTGESLSAKFQPTPQIYFAGGTTNRTGAGAVSTTEVYSPIQNSWITRQGLPASVYGQGGFNIGGAGYSIGGLNASDVGIATNSSYNEITNAYTNKAAYPVVIQYPSTNALNGLGYGAGSSNSTGNSTNQLQQYNATSDTWVSKTAQTHDVYQACLLNGSGLLWQTGGRAGVSTGQNFNQQYSDVTNAWTDKTVLPTGVNVHAGFSFSGKPYVAGGMNTAQNAVSNTQSYNPATDSWTAEGTMTTAIMFCTGVGSQGYGYVEGGTTGSSTSTSFFSQFNPSASVWADKANQGQRQVTANNFSAGSYYNYEMRVFLPALYAGLGNTSTWVARSNMVRVQTIDCNFVIGDQFYGSLGLDGGIVDPSGRTNVTQRYNSVIDTWYFDVPNSMGIGDSGGHSTGNTLLGCGYAMGFNNAAGSLTAQSVKYVPEIRSWSAVANMLVNSGSGNITAPLNGKMYNNGNHPSTGSARMDMYDPSANSWTNKTSSTTTHYAGSAASNGGYFFSVCDATVTNSNEKFNDATNAWTTLTNVPTGTDDNAILNVKDRFQIVGGSPATNLVQEFSPTTNSWQQKTVYPTSAYAPYGGTLNTGVNITAGGNNGSYLATSYAQAPNIKNAVLSAALTIT